MVKYRFEKEEAEFLRQMNLEMGFTSHSQDAGKPGGRFDNTELAGSAGIVTATVRDRVHKTTVAEAHASNERWGVAAKAAIEQARNSDFSDSPSSLAAQNRLLKKQLAEAQAAAQQPVVVREPTKAMLLERAEELGINADGRWSSDRLKKAIAEADTE